MSALSLWSRPDPFVARFDALLRSAFAPLQGSAPFAFTPAAEVTRDGDDALVKVELPGIDVGKDVTVEVDGDQLVVRGERRDEHAEQRDGGTVREVRYGSFQRSFTLPKHVAADTVSADYDAGILTIRVPGAYQGTSPKRIPVSGASQPAIEQPATEAAS